MVREGDFMISMEDRIGSWDQLPCEQSPRFITLMNAVGISAMSTVASEYYD